MSADNDAFIQSVGTLGLLQSSTSYILSLVSLVDHNAIVSVNMDKSSDTSPHPIFVSYDDCCFQVYA